MGGDCVGCTSVVVALPDGFECSGRWPFVTGAAGVESAITTTALGQTLLRSTRWDPRASRLARRAASRRICRQLIPVIRGLLLVLLIGPDVW